MPVGEDGQARGDLGEVRGQRHFEEPISSSTCFATAAKSCILGSEVTREPDWEGGAFVSIVRIGLSETKHFSEGYDAIFGKKKPAQAKKAKATAKKKKKARKK